MYPLLYTLYIYTRIIIIIITEKSSKKELEILSFFSRTHLTVRFQYTNDTIYFISMNTTENQF